MESAARAALPRLTDNPETQRVIVPPGSGGGVHADFHLRAQMEVLTLDECTALLEANQVGRLAMIWEDEPLILPVNYLWDGVGVVFRSDPGTKLDASRNRPVAFEVDGLDHATRRGWSVIVKGQGRSVGPHQLADPHQPPPTLWPWAPSAKHYWIRIEPREISGRRIVRPEMDRP